MKRHVKAIASKLICVSNMIVNKVFPVKTVDYSIPDCKTVDDVVTFFNIDFVHRKKLVRNERIQIKYANIKRRAKASVRRVLRRA